MTAILGAGFFLRLVYVLFSTIYDRQYDTGRIDLEAGHTVTGGHLAYIQYLYENWRLPDFDPTTVYQFNHPPLHHYVSALWLKLCSFFVRDTALLEETLQAVPFVCSLLILIFLLKILGRLGLKEQTKRFLMLLFCFHPALVLLSGSVNNDCMSLLFTVLCVYFGLLWSEQPTLRNIVKLALCLALGLLTKQSAAEMAFPIGALFLWKLYSLFLQGKGFRERGLTGSGLTGRGLLIQYGIFGLLAVPLGMSFYVRNMLLYRMPLVWIYTLPEDSWQYTGNIPAVNRFLWPVPSELFDNLRHFKLGCGYNVWMQLMRTSVLGEWDMAGVSRSVKALALLLMGINALLALAALAAFVYVFFLRPKAYGIGAPVWILFAGSYLVQLCFYLKFAYDYPQECSMHFRYIEIELLFPAAALGMVWQRVRRRWIKGLLNAALAAFAALSAAMTAVWCFFL